MLNAVVDSWMDSVVDGSPSEGGEAADMGGHGGEDDTGVDDEDRQDIEGRGERGTNDDGRYLDPFP